MDNLPLFPHQGVLDHLLPLLQHLLDQETLTPVCARSVALLLRRFTPATVQCLVPGSLGLQLFVRALKQAGPGEGDNSPQLVAINQVRACWIWASCVNRL